MSNWKNNIVSESLTADALIADVWPSGDWMISLDCNARFGARVRDGNVRRARAEAECALGKIRDALTEQLGPTLVWTLAADDSGTDTGSFDTLPMWTCNARRDDHNAFCFGHPWVVGVTPNKGREWHRREVERRLREIGLVFTVREE